MTHNKGNQMDSLQKLKSKGIFQFKHVVFLGKL